jgi:uncharacterized protein (DUF169 family)
MVKVR